MPAHPLHEDLLDLALRAHRYPVSFIQYVIANPGLYGKYATAVLQRLDTPAEYVEPLLEAALSMCFAAPNPRAHALAAAARLRAHHYGPQQAVEALLDADVGHSYYAVVSDLVKAQPAVPGLVEAMLEFGNAGLLEALAGAGDLDQWVQVMLAFDRKMAFAGKSGRRDLINCVRENDGRRGFGRLAEDGTAAHDEKLAQIVHPELLAAILTGDPRVHQLRPTLSDLAATRLVVPVLAGELRGTSFLNSAIGLVTVLERHWTKQTAQLLADAAAQSTLESNLGKGLRAQVAQSTRARLERFTRVERLGVSYAHNPTLKGVLSDPHAEGVSDWIMSTIDESGASWDLVCNVVDALDPNMAFDELVASATGACA